MKVCCEYYVEKETAKAVFVATQIGECHNTTKYNWLPKSACEIEEFVQTVNALGEPQTYGKRVIAVEQWLLRKIK